MSDTVNTAILKLRTELDDEGVQKLDKQLYALGLKVVSFGDKGEQALQRIDTSSKTVEKSFTDLALKVYAALKELQKLFEEMERRHKDQTAAVHETDGAYGKLTRSVGSLKNSLSSFVAEILSPFFEEFNALPDPIKLVSVAIAALGYVCSEAGKKLREMMLAFVKHPLGAVAIVLGAVVGAIGLLNRKSSIDLEAVNANIDAFADSVGRLKKSSDAAKNTKALLEQLNAAKGNQQEYARIAGIILSSNENLKGSNLTVASSYDDIAAAANDAVRAILSMDTVKAIENIEKTKENFENVLDKLLDTSRGMNRGSVRTDVWREGLVYQMRGFDPFSNKSIEDQYAEKRKNGGTERLSGDELRALTVKKAEIDVFMNQLASMIAGARDLDSVFGENLKAYETQFLTLLNDNDYKIHIPGTISTYEESPFIEWFKARLDALSTAETARRENIRNAPRRVSTTGNVDIKDPSYDLEALRIKAMEDSYARQEELADKAYNEELLRLTASADYKAAMKRDEEEAATALYNLSVTRMEAEAELRSKIDEESFEARKELRKITDEDVYAYRARLAEEAYERDIADIKARGLAEDAMNAAVARRERAHNKELQGIETERIAKSKEKQIKAFNDMGEALETAMSLATEPLEKALSGDKAGAKKALGNAIKSGIGLGLKAIPGIGSTLSGVFSTAVNFFGSLFKRRAESVAQKLGKWLEQAAKKFNIAMDNIEVGEILLGELDINVMDDKIAAAKKAVKEAFGKMGLDFDTTNLSREEIYKLYTATGNVDKGIIDAAAKYYKNSKTRSNQIFDDNVTRDMKRGYIDKWVDDADGGHYEKEYISEEEIERFKNSIRSFYKEVYGESAEAMMRASGVLTAAGDIDLSVWMKVDGQIFNMNNTIRGLIKETANWIKTLDDANIKKGFAKINNELDKINTQYELGELEFTDMIDLSLKQLQAGIDYLETLERTEEVQKAINDLTLQQINLKKRLSEAELLERHNNDAELMDLLARETELERDIATGKKRAGDYDTVEEQESLYLAIMNRIKALGGSRDEYFPWEEKHAKLMEATYGTGYHAAAGQGYTPGTKDINTPGMQGADAPLWLMSSDPYNPAYLPSRLDPAVMYPKIPYYATPAYRAAMAQDMARWDAEDAIRASGGAVPISTTNNMITNTNTVTFNGETIQIDDDFIDELDETLRRRFGRRFFDAAS